MFNVTFGRFARVQTSMNNFLTWQNISFLGRSKFINSFSYWFILVPLMQKVISNYNFELPVNLKVLFVCSVFFGIANIWYKVSCPELIKFYRNPQDFLLKGGNIFQLNHIIEELEVENPIHDEDNDEKKLKEKFSMLVTECLDTARAGCRWIISILYFIALVLLLWLALINIISVLFLN